MRWLAVGVRRSGGALLLPVRLTPPHPTQTRQRGLFGVPSPLPPYRPRPSFEKRCLPVFASLPQAAIMQTPAALFLGFAAPSRHPKPLGGGLCPRPPFGRGWRLPRGATLRCYALPLVLPAFLRLGPAAAGFCRCRQKGCFSAFCLLRAAARLVSLCAWATRAFALGAPLWSASCARGPPPRACGLGGSPPLLALPRFRRASPSGRAPPRRAGLREGGVPPQGAGRFFRLARSRLQGLSGLRPLPLPVGRGQPLLRARSRFELRHFVFLNKRFPSSCRPPLGPTSARVSLLVGDPPRFCTKKKRNAE